MKIFTTLLAVLCPMAALANGGGYSYSNRHGALGLFEPKNAGKVEMQTESLNIELGAARAKVEVEYTLVNPGPAVTVEAAFPGDTQNDSLNVEAGQTTALLHDFAVSSDGKALKHRVATDEPKRAKAAAAEYNTRPVHHWYVFKVDFKAGQKRTLKASYDVGYSGGVFSVSGHGAREATTFDYLFSTAAIWKGAIQSGKVTVRVNGVNPDAVKFNLPKRFKRVGNIWTWSFENFEPTLADDLRIVVDPRQNFFAENLPGVTDEDGDPVQVEYVEVQGRWEMQHRLYTVKASSTLPRDGELDYKAENVRGSYGKAWSEGVEGDGLGESLSLTLRQPRKVSHLIIANGYQKVRSEGGSFEANNRVAEFGVSVNGGKPVSVPLEDARECRIALPGDGEEVKTIRLIIQKIYPGKKYHDTCISDIALVTPLSKKPKIQPVR